MFSIRWLLRVNLPDVLAIEQESFPCPWDESDFIAVLKHSDTIGMAARDGDKIVGFMLYRNGPVNGLEVLNFAVAKMHRRQRIGQSMTFVLRQKMAIYRSCPQISVEVRESNLQAQLFWRAVGFKAVEVRRNFFVDNNEDSYRFALKSKFEKLPEVRGEQVNQWERVPSRVEVYAASLGLTVEEYLSRMDEALAEEGKH